MKSKPDKLKIPVFPSEDDLPFNIFEVDFKNKKIVVKPSVVNQRLDFDMNDSTGSGGSIILRHIDFTSGDATPSVKNANMCETAGTTTITDFDDGVIGQVIFIKATGNITIQHTDGTINLVGSADFDMRNGDILVIAMVDDQIWDEVTRNAVGGTPSEKSWSFESAPGAAGTFYTGGFYNFSATDNDFSPAITFGTVNSSYAAHFLTVLGGVAPSVDELTIRITGTSITDQGVRTAGDTEDIVYPSGSAISTYKETILKWLGRVSISVVSGTPVKCGYGYCKYWDNNNSDFIVLGLEATWFGGANDTAPDIKLRHHRASGWTYVPGLAPLPPPVLANMETDHSSTEDNVINGEYGAWKRDNLSTAINGASIEGTIIEIETTANKTFEQGNFLLRIRPN